MKLRKLFAGLLAALLLLSAAALADVTIGVPDDTTNEARALQLLADNGIIELAEGAGETATKADVIADGVEIVEVQADQLVNQLPDLDYAVINSNFVLDALDAGFEINKALLTEVEEKYLPRANVIAVNGDNVDADLTKALVAAATSQQVKDYIEATYAGAVLSVVENPTDGYDPDVVIVALGSNGAIRDDAMIQDAVDAVGGRPIYFVTVRNPYPIQDTNNEMLRANAATNANAGIIDWNGASEGHDDYIVADGTHPTAEGMEVYAKLIRQALVGV